MGLLAGGVCSAAMVGVETFETGLSGFQQGSTSTVVAHSATGGNPDGQMLLRRDLQNPGEMGGRTTTNAIFIGDYAAAGIGGMTVDLNFGTDNVTGAFFRLRSGISDNGWRAPLTNQFTPTNTWSTYTLFFDPTWTDAEAQLAGWTQEAGPSPSFATLMASVGWAEIRITGLETSTIVGVDNFGLTSGVPEPSTALLLGCGLGALVAWRRRRSG